MKRITTILLALASLSLTACKQDGSAPSTGGGDTPTIAQPDVPVVTPTPSPAPSPSPVPSPSPSPVPAPTPAPSPSPQPTVDPLHACAGFAALGTWVNMTDSTDILIFNNDCTMAATYCNQTFNYALPPTTSLTHANIDFPTDKTGIVDPASTALTDHLSSCQPANHINQQNRDMYYSPNDPDTGLPMPAGYMQFTWRYNGAYVYQQVP